MNQYFSGFNTKEITLCADSTVIVGCPVKLSDEGTVALAADGEKFCGICTALNGSYASVVLSGFVTAYYAGTLPTLGYCKLTGNGDKRIKVSDEGREYLVVGINQTYNTFDFII